MNKLQVHNAVGADGFTFIGNKRMSLTSFTDEGFILLPYDEPRDQIEYDFNGKFIRKYTEAEYEKKVPWTPERCNLHKKHKNVVEVPVRQIWGRTPYGSDRTPPPKDLLPVNTDGQTWDQVKNATAFQTVTVYDNQTEFQTVINSVGDVNKLTECEEWICGDIKLIRWSGEKPLFIISRVEDNRIISATCFDGYHFLDGDSGTSVYVVNGKHILMWNDGDCPSVLFMRNKSKNIKMSPIDLATMSCAESIESAFKDLRQSIVNLLYRFYDEDRYGVYLDNGATYSVRRKSSNKHFLTVVQSGNELKLTKSDDSSLVVNMNDLTNEIIVRVREFTKIA